MKENIIVTGDLHGYWNYLNDLLNKKKPEKAIVCGDFGYWPHMHNSKKIGRRGIRWDQYGIKNHVTEVFWLDGNHENHEELKILATKYGYQSPINMKDFEENRDKKYKPIYYLPRCCVVEFNDQRCLFIGGADSIDKMSRREGISWWRGEVISHSDYLNLPEEDIAIVFSHTIPSFLADELFIDLWGSQKMYDPSCKILEEVFYKYKPKKWYFGHFHKFYNIHFEGCEFIGLDMAGHMGKWWCYM